MILICSMFWLWRIDALSLSTSCLLAFADSLKKTSILETNPIPIESEIFEKPFIGNAHIMIEAIITDRIFKLTLLENIYSIYVMKYIVVYL